MTPKKLLATSTNDFPKMITDNYVYVDKTEIIYTLIATGLQYCLLTRPRRFGKSLLISTMNEIFSGNKELFRDCWIGQQNKYDWQQYPIIRIDLSNLDSTAEGNLTLSLGKALDKIGTQYNIDLSEGQLISIKLNTLIRELGTQRGVVLLIDEYDYPLIAHAAKPELVQHNTEVLRTFYTILKRLGGYIKFLFMTGVSKFPQESIFSGLNNVKDISLLATYAAITGYTEQELLINYLPYITEIAQERSVSIEIVLDDMRRWYNGYHFSNKPLSVYNPFSITNYLSDKEFKNHWFLSGTPTFLRDFLKAKKFTTTDLEKTLENGSSLNAFDPTTISLGTLLYQTGYLTIKPSADFMSTYDLQYPNYEVQMSMYQNLLASFTSLEYDKIVTIGDRLKKSVKQNDMAALCSGLSALLANIPYDLQLEYEAYYHSIFHTTGFLLGLDTRSETHTSNGRIDLTIEYQNTVIIIELKCKQSAHKALAQIHENGYYEKFLSQEKKIFLIGFAVNFPNEKLTTSWIIEELPTKP